MSENSLSTLVLDTHVWIWLANKDANLGPRARAYIEQSGLANEVLISAMSVWEVAMLQSANRIQIPVSIRNWIDQALTIPGIVFAPLTPGVAIDACNLPGNFHGDPADRIIVATARCQSAILVTQDAKIHDYAKQGYLRTMVCAK